MNVRGLIDRKGELFAYFRGNILFTLEGEITGRVEGSYIVDVAGNRMWRIYGDGVYSLDGAKTIGYISSKTPDDF
jgi:hypothetical protein